MVYNVDCSQSSCPWLETPRDLLLCVLAPACGFFFSLQRKTQPKCRARKYSRLWESVSCLDVPLKLPHLCDIVVAGTTVILEAEKVFKSIAN